MKILRVAVVAYPLLPPFLVYATWLAAWWTLGRWPQPSLDDPKSIGWVVTALYHATIASVFVGLPLFVVGILALWGRCWTLPAERRANGVTSTLALAGIVAAYALLRWDPLATGPWLAD